MDQEKVQVTDKEKQRESQQKESMDIGHGKPAENQDGKNRDRDRDSSQILLNPRVIGVGVVLLFLILLFKQVFLQNPLEGIGAAEADPDSPDESATVEEFRKFGMPDLDRVWTGEDLAQAEEVLSRLSKFGFQYFPRYRSFRSGALFARLTSMDNLKPFTDPKVALKARFTAANQFLGPTNQILELYFEGQSQSKIRVIEVVEVMALQLHIAKLNMELVEQVMPEMDKADPNYPERMAELEGVKRGIAGLILGGMAYLTEGRRDRQSELKRLVVAMQETFPQLFARISLSSRQTCLTRLDRVIYHPRLKELKPELIKLKEMVLVGLGASDSEKKASVHLRKKQVDPVFESHSRDSHAPLSFD